MLDKQIWEIENNIDYKEELDARFDSRKSFYKKAYVVYCKNGDIALQSYNTIVAVLKKSGEFEYSKYSQTTNRHIKEFKRQFVD